MSCIRSNNGPNLRGDERNWLCPSCEIFLHCHESGLSVKCITKFQNLQQSSIYVDFYLLLQQPLYKCTLCFSFYHLDCHDADAEEKTKPLPSKRFQYRNCVQYAGSMQKKRKAAVTSETTTTTTPQNQKSIAESDLGRNPKCCKNLRQLERKIKIARAPAAEAAAINFENI